MKTGRKKNRGEIIVRWMFVLAGILLLLSLFNERFSSDYSKAAARTGRILEERMEILDGFIDKALDEDWNGWDEDMEIPDDMVIYRYVNDSLKSWCNGFPLKNDDISNRILIQRLTRPLSDLRSPLMMVNEDVQFVNYGQKWYLVKSRMKGFCKVVAGLEVVNSVLEGRYGGINPALKGIDGHSLTTISESGGFPVYVGGKPVFKLIENNASSSTTMAHSALVLTGILLIIIALFTHLANKRCLKRLLLVIPGLVMTMAAAYFWGKAMQDRIMLFSPLIFSGGKLFDSLGAVMIFSSGIIFLICCLFFTRDDLYRKILASGHPESNLKLFTAILTVLTLGVSAYIFLIIRSLIFNSNITLELFRLNDLSKFSILVYVMLALLIISVTLLFQMTAPALKKVTGLKINFFSRFSKVLTAALFALWIVLETVSFGFQKEQDRVTILANRLSIERDLSLELELRRQEDKISSDQYLASFAAMRNSERFMLNRILETHLSRIYQDYDFGVETFPENESTPQSMEYFTNMVSGGAAIADGSRFRYHSLENGECLYVGSFAYYDRKNGLTMMLLSITPKQSKGDKGYSSLLGISAPGEVLVPSAYSYAKYSSGKLVSYKGNYAYPTRMDASFKDELDNAANGIARIGGHVHFINKVAEDEYILVSRTQTGSFNYIVTFLFTALSIYFALSILTLTKRHRKVKEKNYYKSRINAAMMLALIMTLIALGAVSVAFVNKRNNANLYSSMAEKISSMQSMVQARCRMALSWNDLNTPEGSSILDDVSNTMKSDITLFNTSGREFRSTTPDLFDRMILNSRIDEKAYRNIIYKNRRYFINREKIRGRKATFLYAPVFNGMGEMVAIMSSPYTDESFDFKSEAVLHSVTIIMVFIILLILARFITATAVDKMFKPLTEMGHKMNAASIENLEYIVYERDDEVSSLVRAYNLMVHDLSDSTKQLTMNERDKAWATMARQVAHEIKNPLTPIKLQIQRLIRMKSNGNPAWEERFDEISEEVLKQIDMLADTANEFSTFAKLYSQESVEIDLDKLLQEEIALFDSRENITFSYMGLDGAKVTGPKPQLTRVFTNLIGNAVQAVENAQASDEDDGGKARNGNVLVSLRYSSKDGYYDIVFEDNGPGVSDENRSKLFTPNFTTKNTGTGLGLAICRNILEKCNAEIFYTRSFTLKGACFTVRYPMPEK